MIMKYIRNKVRKIVRAIMEEDETQSHICDLVEANLDLPDAEDVAEAMSVYDVAQEVDISTLAYEIDVSDIVYELDQQDIAEKVAQNFEMDYCQIVEHMDTDEVASQAADYLDLEAIARHADVDKTIFTHIHMLQTKLDALVEVVRGSAMNTLDLMTFNKALEGEE
mgnify:CR=1 FL=1